MRAWFSNAFQRSIKKAPLRVRKDFDKQLNYLLLDLRHPSLRAKKYDESKDIWQARVNRDWRFYFIIDGDIYRCLDIMEHPK
jgi:mRNA interferase RelE/StbE